MPDDPISTDPALYRVVFENDRVRVLEYRDRPGDVTHPHGHPDSVMVTVTSFRRRLHGDDGRQVDVDLAAGEARWIGAQEHAGENIGTTETHSIFVELKEPAPSVPVPGETPLGPGT
jgi:hypothetical protein